MTYTIEEVEAAEARRKQRLAARASRPQREKILRSLASLESEVRFTREVLRTQATMVDAMLDSVMVRSAEIRQRVEGELPGPRGGIAEG